MLHVITQHGQYYFHTLVEYLKGSNEDQTFLSKKQNQIEYCSSQVAYVHLYVLSVMLQVLKLLIVRFDKEAWMQINTPLPT